MLTSKPLCTAPIRTRDVSEHGESSIPRIEANAPTVLWASDFRDDSTVHGIAIKIAILLMARLGESVGTRATGEPTL